MCDEHSAAQKPHVLLLATQRWPTGARLGLAMSAAGFRVSLWAVADHPLLHTRLVSRHFPCRSFDMQGSLEAAVAAANADLVVPCDDLSTQLLQQLALRAQQRTSLRHLLPVIERSLGPAAQLNRLNSRAHVLQVASGAGLPVPATTPLQSAQELRAWFAEHGFPAYLKADGSSGGRGVCPVHTYEEAAAAFALLDAPPEALLALKRVAIDGDPSFVIPVLRRRRPAISVQRAVFGVEANSAMFCWKGRVLALSSVQVLATSYERGPSTVVRRIDHPGMRHAAQVLAAQLELSGFYGLDFLLEEQTGTPWLLEMNSRATQIAHLALGPGSDLAAAAFAAVTGTTAQPRSLLTAMHDIALFPQEWQRDPISPMLHTCYHDVPWESAELVRAYINQRPGWRRLLTRRYWQERSNRGAVAAATVPEAASRLP